MATCLCNHRQFHRYIHSLQPTLAEDQWLGALIAFISGILAALAYLQVKHLGNLGEPEYRVVFYFCVIGTIGGAIMAVIAAHMPGGDGIPFHGHSVLSVFYLVFIGVSAALGQMAMTRAYHLGNTLVTANLQYSGIVFSCIWGLLIWNDNLSWLGWLGIAIIICQWGHYDILRRASSYGSDCGYV